MIINLCDYCGQETERGKNIRLQKLTFEPRLTKRWKAEDHAASRLVHVAVQFGIDGCNPEVEHPGHDVCEVCQHKILLQVLRHIEGDER